MKSTSGAARLRYPSLVFLVLLALLLTFTLGSVGGQSAGAAGPPEMVKVFVAFDRMAGPAEQALVRAAGGEIRHTYTIVPALSASIPEAALAGLAKNPRVVRIEPVLEAYAIDAELDYTWGVETIGAGLVHDAGTTGAGVEVAVIDSGIDNTHPDLDANYAGGWDFANDDPYPMDDNGHGTHVAGTIAAEDNNEGVVGVAPGAQVYGLKVLGADGSGYYDDIVAALEWVVTQNTLGANIQVTNNSYGSSGDPGETVRQAFDNSYTAGVLHIAAAGNSGNRGGGGDSVIYPARYSSVVAVAAVDSNDGRASFSSTGPDVEMAAPGVAIPSTVPDGGYESWSGTSMASPHVAGTAALLIASDVATTPEAIRLRLQETAVDLGTAGHDSKYGYGRVDAPAAVGVPVGEPDDTNPPAAPIDLTASAADSQVSLDWADNSESDLAGYNVYRSTTSGSDYTTNVNDSLVLGSTFTDTGLTNGTTYYYVVTAVDTAGNESPYSKEASATPTAGSSTPGTIGATDITFATEGGRYGTAHLLIGVVIEDTNAQPIANASVTISVLYPDGATSSHNGTTDSSGTASFKLTNAPNGFYTVTVTDVSASGLTWDEEQYSKTWDKQ